MKQMGLFYNLNFDTISVIINNESNSEINHWKIKAKVIEPGLAELSYNDHIIGFNVDSVSSRFNLKGLTPGINSDNKELINLIKEIVPQSKINLSEFNQTPQFKVGKVVSKIKHPKSEKLSICEVDLKTSIEQIVCGAPNVDINQLVVVAMIGAVMPSGLKILPAKLLDVNSNGMICSARELGLPDPGVKGILILDSSKYQMGMEFWNTYYEKTN